MGWSDLVQKAVYIGIGAASYAGEKAGSKLNEFGGQLQKLADEMVERGEMTTEEARRYVDEKMKTAQQEFENLAQQAQKPKDTPKEPRRIEIVDEDSESSVSQTSSVAQPEPVKIKEEPSKPEANGNPVEDMRRQVAELQEELRRLRS